MKKNLSYIYIVLGIIHLLGILINQQEIIWLTKPLLMVFLAVYFVMNVGVRNKENLLIFVALIFAQIGDSLLMYADSNATFFIAGILSFLMTQILYSYSFYLISPKNKNFLQKKPLFIIPFVLYLFGFLYLLLPKLEMPLSAAVCVYGIVLTSMSILALNLKNKIDFTNWRLILFGAILFVLSDSMIAINKFFTKIPMEGFLIMSTYIVGQFFIINGWKKEQELRIKNLS